jgi:archaeosine-15-forming tRNA-guanine transglycosylase
MLNNSRQSGKSLAAKYVLEAAIARGERVLVVSANNTCLIIPGPWKYQPSFVRDSYK